MDKKHGFDFPAHVPLNSSADIILVTTMVSEIGVLSEAMVEQTILQPCFYVVTSFGVPTFKCETL